VVAIGIPGSKRFLFRCPFHPAELERKRRHTLLDEAVLVTANEPIMLRFLIGLYMHACGFANNADIVAQGGLIQALNFQVLQREQWKIHIHINVGDNRS
jgi:hypothetical protein